MFVEYTQVFEGIDNTMKPRCVGVIMLEPNGNAQGGVIIFIMNKYSINTVTITTYCLCRGNNYAKQKMA